MSFYFYRQLIFWTVRAHPNLDALRLDLHALFFFFFLFTAATAAYGSSQVELELQLPAYITAHGNAT